MRASRPRRIMALHRAHLTQPSSVQPGPDPMVLPVCTRALLHVPSRWVAKGWTCLLWWVFADGWMHGGSMNDSDTLHGT